MRPKTRGARLAVYALLALGSAVFLLPLVWLVVTSLKPVEQTMSIPPTWIPRAYVTSLGGRRTEVTRDYVIAQKSAIVDVADSPAGGPTSPAHGPSGGRRMLVPLADFDAETGRAKIQVFTGGARRQIWYAATLVRTVDPGAWHVTERSATTARTHELAWDIVPESDIESTLSPRWDNYPKALTELGGGKADGPGASGSGKRTGKDARVGFLTFLANTLIVCGLGVAGAVMSNALVAYGLAKIKWKGRRALFAVTLATMMVPFPVLMVPLYGVFKALGLVGSLYPLWLPAFFGSAFNIFLMRQFFLTIPDELGEAARIDGCSEWGIFFRIVLPLSKPVLAVVALFHFLHAWNDFLGPLLYLTRKHTFTLALALQNYQSQVGGVQWPYLMAASAVLVVPIIVLFFFAQKTFIRGIATTGIKG